jgi:hypothetical protein
VNRICHRFDFFFMLFALGALDRVALAEAIASEVDAPNVSVGALLFVPSDIYNSDGGEGAKPQAGGDLGAAAAFEAARKAAETGEVSAAIRAACRAVALDPDHAEARRLLGYRKVGEHWAGGYAQQMLASGHVWRREFGWIKEKDASQYEQGLRPWGNRWITVEEDAERHATIERGWTVRTDHFLIRTNIDRAAGVELAVRLETLYQLWRQLFGEFAVLPAELTALLHGKETAGFLRRPFHVIYHRSRDEYNQALLPRQPQIGITLGIYFDVQRESHFFAGEDQDAGTIAHEAVHQFFYESTRHATRRLAATANAWAIEGVACYFESLMERKSEGGARAFTIGTPEAGRLPAARHRRVVDNYYVPLAELSALAITELQHREDLARLYSQSAGLASFFIDYKGGVYRSAFRELLALVYAGRDTADKLAELSGRSFEDLDAEYLKYMEGLPVTGVLAP